MTDAPKVLGEDLVKGIVDLLGRYKKVEPDGWNAETKLEDIGVDSFDFVEFVFMLEDEYHIEIDYNANDTATSLNTVGDVAKAVGTILEAKGAK